MVNIQMSLTNFSGQQCLLYIFKNKGGQRASDLLAPELNILDLSTMMWYEPVFVVPRHSHFCAAYKDRLFIYGGTTPSMDP